MDLLQVHWPTVWSNLTLLGIAYVLALPIALNREKNERSAGLRTFPLVAMATCGFMLVGMDVLTNADAQARVMGGIITGMGFIGGGAILKSGKVVTGTATAVSLWTTGAIGIAVARQRYEIALLLSLLTFATLQFFGGLKEQISDNPTGDATHDEKD